MDGNISRQILEHFYSTLHNLDSYNPKLIIAFSAVPGAGKTFIAEQIERKYKAIRINNDRIRDAIHKVFANIDAKQTEEIKRQYLVTLLDNLKRQKNGLIVLDSSIDRSYQQIINWCKVNHYELIVIRLDVDKKVIIKRLKDREGTNAGNYLQNVDRWFKDYRNFNENYEADFIIENNNNIDQLEKKSVDTIGTFKSIVLVHIFLLVLGLLFFIIDPKIPDLNLEFFILLFIFGAADFCGYILFYQAFKVSKISLITPITGSYAIFTAILSFLFFGEVFSLHKFLLIILVVVGIVLLSIDLKDLRMEGKKNFRGIFYAIILFFLYGTWVPFWDKFISRGGIFFILELERLVILFCAVMYLILKDKKRVFSNWGTKAVRYTFLSSICIVVAATVYNWGLYKTIETSLISAISSSYPLIAVLSAYFFLNERLKLNQYIGILIVIFGLVLITVY